VASFTVASAPPGAATSFDASASTVRFGTIARYDWAFGDGTLLPDGGPTPSHVYTFPGSYTATVTETDSAGTSVSGEVYTGQSASRVGNPSAGTSRSVVITNAPAPAVALSASSLDFGTVAVGSPSAPQTLQITNTGNAPLVISGSARSGPQVGDFMLSADTCSGRTIAPGARCDANLNFTPSAGGGRSARVAFTDNASGSPHTVSLAGTGTTLGGVTGHVLDAANSPATPAAGALVSICPRRQNGIEFGGARCRSTRTDSTGAYNLLNLTPGSSAMEVSPASASLAGGSAILTVPVGPPTVQDFHLHASRPLPKSITFTSATGSSALYWDAPFQIALPIAPAPARATPNSVGITTLSVSLSSGSQRVLGSLLVYFTVYDGSGNAVGGIGGSRTLPETLLGGFDLTFGGLAIPSGGSAIAVSRSLGTASQIIAQSSGLRRQAHGDLALTIRGRRVFRAPMAHRASGRATTRRTARAYDAACQDALDARAAFEQTIDPVRVAFIVEEGALGDAATEALVRQTGAFDIAVKAACGGFDPDDPPSPAPQLPPCGFGGFDCQPSIYCTEPEACSKPVDPSGFVVTRTGVPLERARVVLQRSDAAAGPFRPPPGGSQVMASDNRRNPDFTDLNGHFGWNVFPGYYRVAATRRGCRGTALSPSSPVPPPVTNLRLKLSCPGLHRPGTLTRILSAKLRGPDTRVVVSVVRKGRGPRPTGLITLQIPRRHGGFAFVDARTGRATIVLAGRLGRGTRLTARYAGNARFAPSRARTRR
jgi:hypothetical protein